MTNSEEKLFSVLEVEDVGVPDRSFLVKRLARFAQLPPERIVSTLPRADFLARLSENRRLRSYMVSPRRRNKLEVALG